MGLGIQRRRGTTAQHNSFTGKPGEMTVDTTKNTVVVHDGSTLGGHPLAKETHAHSTVTSENAGFMSSSDKDKIDALPVSVVYQEIQANNTPLTKRNAINFSTQFAITDDDAGNKTTINISDKGITPGAFTKVTVNANGIITAAGLLTGPDVPNITAAQVSDFDTQVRTSRLDQMASPTTNVDLNDHRIVDVADPVNPKDAANKQYVDATRTGLTFKESARVTSTTNINISLPGSQIDGVDLVEGDRILLKNQSVATANGIYVFNGASTPMTRSADANTSENVVPGAFILVNEGTINADTAWVLSTDAPITLGSTDLEFVQFSGAATVSAGNGLDKVGNTLNVLPVSTERLVANGSGLDLAASGVTPGAYNTVTVDTYGRVTAASNTAYQAQTDVLTSISAIATNGLIARTGAGTSAARTLTAGTGIEVANGTGASGNPTVSVIPDTTNQRAKISAAGSLIGTRPELNFIAGEGIAINAVDDTPTNRVNVTIQRSGGISTDATFLTLSSDEVLTNERVLTAGTGIQFADSGAGGALTVSIISDLGNIV